MVLNHLTVSPAVWSATILSLYMFLKAVCITTNFNSRETMCQSSSYCFSYLHIFIFDTFMICIYPRDIYSNVVSSVWSTTCPDMLTWHYFLIIFNCLCMSFTNVIRSYELFDYSPNVLHYYRTHSLAVFSYCERAVCAFLS